MKITVLKHTLVQELERVLPVVPKSTKVAILKSVLLKAENGILEISATDLNMHVTCHMGCETCESGGSIAIDAVKLLAVLKATKETAVTIEAEDSAHKATVADQLIEYTSSEEFHNIPTLAKEEEGFIMLYEDLDTIAKYVEPKASKDPTRKALWGTLLHEADEVGGCMVAVATDGHRLTKHVLTKHSSIYFPTPTIVRSGVFKIAAKMFNFGKFVAVAKWGNYIYFKYGNCTLSSKVIDEQYPKYQNAIPKTFAGQVTLGVKQLLEAAKALQHDVNKRTQLVILEISQAGGFTIKGDSLAYPVTSNTTEAIRIGCNLKFLVELIKGFEMPEVTIKFNHPHAAMVVESRDTKQLRLLMPLRIPD